MAFPFTPVDDERLHSRVPVWVAVAASRDGEPGPLAATLIDVSQGGALIQVPWGSPWCEGEALHLQLDDGPESVACRVVAVEPAMGATCLHVAFAPAPRAPDWLSSVVAGLDPGRSEMPRWQAGGAALLERARMAPLH